MCGPQINEAPGRFAARYRTLGKIQDLVRVHGRFRNQHASTNDLVARLRVRGVGKAVLHVLTGLTIAADVADVQAQEGMVVPGSGGAGLLPLTGFGEIGGGQVPEA